MKLHRFIRYVLELLARKVLLIIESSNRALWIFIYERTSKFLRHKTHILMFLQRSPMFKYGLEIFLETYSRSLFYVESKSKVVPKLFKDIIYDTSLRYFPGWANSAICYIMKGINIEGGSETESDEERSNTNGNSKEGENGEKSEDTSNHSKFEKAFNDAPQPNINETELSIDSVAENPQKRKSEYEHESKKRSKFEDLEERDLKPTSSKYSEIETKDTETGETISNGSSLNGAGEKSLASKTLLIHECSETSVASKEEFPQMTENDDDPRGSKTPEPMCEAGKHLESSPDRSVSNLENISPSTSSGKSYETTADAKDEQPFVDSKISKVCKNLPSNIAELVSQRMRRSTKAFKTVRASQEKRAFLQSKDEVNPESNNNQINEENRPECDRSSEYDDHLMDYGQSAAEPAESSNNQTNEENRAEFDKSSASSGQPMDSIKSAAEPTAKSEDHLESGEPSDSMETFYDGPSTSTNIRPSNISVPGLALKPFKVKKDAMYQKKFYKHKKGVTLPAILGKIIERMINESRQSGGSDSESEVPDSEMTEDEFRDCAQNLARSIMEAYREMQKRKTPEKPVENVKERVKHIRPRERSGYAESSFIEESPPREPSDKINFQTPPASPTRPSDPRLTPNSKLSRVIVSPVKPVMKVSPQPKNLEREEDPELVTIDDSSDNSLRPFECSDTEQSGSASLPLAEADSGRCEQNTETLKPCSFSETSSVSGPSTGNDNADVTYMYDMKTGKLVAVNENRDKLLPVEQSTGQSEAELETSREREIASSVKNESETQRTSGGNSFLNTLLDRPCTDTHSKKFDFLGGVEHASDERFNEPCSQNVININQEDIEFQKILWESILNKESQSEIQNVPEGIENVSDSETFVDVESIGESSTDGKVPQSTGSEFQKEFADRKNLCVKEEIADCVWETPSLTELNTEKVSPSRPKQFPTLFDVKSKSSSESKCKELYPPSPNSETSTEEYQPSCTSKTDSTSEKELLSQLEELSPDSLSSGEKDVDASSKSSKDDE